MFFYPKVNPKSVAGALALMNRNKGVQREVWILSIMFLQLSLGSFLFKKMRNGEYGKKVFILQFFHRVNGMFTYLLTKFRFWCFMRDHYFESMKAMYYSCFLIYLTVLISVYAYLYFVYWRVTNLNFDDALLINSMNNNLYLKEVLMNIENGDFEIPKNHRDINVNNIFKKDAKEFLKKNLFKKKKKRNNDHEKFFIDNENNYNQNESNEQSVTQDNSEKLENVSINLDNQKLGNPTKMLWVMIENKIYDIRCFNHSRGVFLFNHILFSDLTLKMYKRKSLKFEFENNCFIRKLRGDEISRGYYLLKEKCLGFIDTNQNLIFRDTPDLREFTLSRAKSKKHQNLLNNRFFRSNMKKRNSRNPKNDHRSFHSQRLGLADSMNVSALTNHSMLSKHTLNSNIVTKNGNQLEFLDRQKKLTEYVNNWRLVHSQKISNSFSIHFIKNIKENFFLNLKNYWLRNLGKYYLCKWGNKRRFYYVCNALHPKYLARKYLSFASSDIGILNYLFVKMGRIEQILVGNYLGLKFHKVKKAFEKELMNLNTPEDTNTLKIFWEHLRQKEDSLLIKSQFSSDLSHENLKTSEQREEIKMDTNIPQADMYRVQAEQNGKEMLETINEERFYPKNKMLNLVCNLGPVKPEFTHEPMINNLLSHLSPDHCSNLGTPFSHLVPLIRSPLNGSTPPNSQLVKLLSNLGLGINLQNFSDQNVLFVVKDYGILPILDLLELILQVRIKHLKKILSVLESNCQFNNSEISCYKINEEKCQKIKKLIKKHSTQAINLEFSAFSLECFDEEYLFTFANMPQFNLYWEMSDSFGQKCSMQLAPSNIKRAKRAKLEDIGSLLGLQIINEFQVVDTVVRDLLMDFVEQSSNQKGVIDNLPECDQFTLSLKSKQDVHSQWSELSSSTRVRDQGHQLISNANIERLGRNSMLKNVCVASSSDYADTLQQIGSSVVTVQKGKARRFKDVKEAVFGVSGIGVYDKVCFSGSDAWVNRVMKGAQNEDVTLRVL